MQAPRLYALPHRPEALRVALALGAKNQPCEIITVDWFDDETFFALGIAREPCALALDSEVLTDSVRILAEMDERFSQPPALRQWVIDDPAWQALIDWRKRVDAVLERLYAPLGPGFRGLGDNPEALAEFQAGISRRFGLTLEELANDRYDGFGQFSRLSRLTELAQHLARERFYMGHFSIADCLLAADLYPLQMHDGINLPIDLMYYLARVEEHCSLELNRDWLSR